MKMSWSIRLEKWTLSGPRIFWSAVCVRSSESARPPYLRAPWWASPRASASRSRVGTPRGGLLAARLERVRDLLLGVLDGLEVGVRGGRQQPNEQRRVDEGVGKRNLHNHTFDSR